MISYGRVVEIAAQYNDAAGSRISEFAELQIARNAIHEVWSAREWPWHKANHSITLIPSYSTGTINLTEGSANVVGVGTTWSTSWPMPALLRGPNGQPFFVTFINSTTTLTMADAYVGTSVIGQSYNLGFPAYPVPSDFGSTSDPIQSGILFRARPGDYAEWFDLTHTLSHSGPIEMYAFKEGDGLLEPAKMFLYPTPAQAAIARMAYRAKVPDLYRYAEGTASVANGSPTVTGIDTFWTKMGFAAGGAVISFPDVRTDAFGTISSAGADGTITLSANWSGPTVPAGSAYHISTRVKMPDVMLAPLTSLVQEKVALSRGWSNSAQAARASYDQLLHQIERTMYLPQDAVSMRLPTCLQGALRGGRRHVVPGPPTTIIVES